MKNMIGVIVLHLCLWRLDGVFGDEVKSVSVMEGDNVTLHTDITEIQEDDVMEWMFGVQSPDEIIAEFNREANTTSFNNERFKNHLYLNHQTGDLIITNITNKHTGLYQVEITRKTSVVIRHFNVTVNVVVCCGFTEAVIRLVVSALVGVAAVAILVYDIRSR